MLIVTVDLNLLLVEKYILRRKRLYRIGNIGKLFFFMKLLSKRGQWRLSAEVEFVIKYVHGCEQELFSTRSAMPSYYIEESLRLFEYLPMVMQQTFHKFIST